jgi:glycogen(starch) synthase
VTEHQSARVAVVTPWYPSSNQPFAGAFVQAMVDATAPGTAMTVYHCEEWGHRLPVGAAAEIEAAYEVLQRFPQRPALTAGGAELVRVPVPIMVGLSYAEIARRHDAVLRGALDGAPIDAEVVHAHVGLPGGWAALHNARPGAKVYVTEHASFLDQILEQPDARAMYGELLARCDGLFAVGRTVIDPLVTAFPEHLDKISHLPNPVAFGQARPEPVTELKRWLFVGNLTRHKGVDRLLEAFARCRADDASLKLTFVGDGESRRTLIKEAAELGVTDAVTFTGRLSPAEAHAAMREHDLLVHPSRGETFGMAVVEAVDAGMPVLVTRCGGPEETLAGVEDLAGELIEIEDGSDALVEGYARLRNRFPAGVDVDRARRELTARYSYPAVREAYHRVWFGDAR